MKITERIGNGTTLITNGDLKYIEFDCLNKYKNLLTHCMSTRIGGVSTGECSSLNLGFNRGDSRKNVLANFQLLCDSVGFDMQSLVFTNQVHGKKICLIDGTDKGLEFTEDSSLISVDGLLTTTPGVTMVTYHADCIPVYLFEPGIKAAALLHSGWRGTLNEIVPEALTKLRALPGFSVNRLVAVIGPSIGSCCFEVGEDVYTLFKEKFRDPVFYLPAGTGKWMVDLQKIIEFQLLSEGLDGENICNSGICTKCRNDLFFSYRGDKGKTGSLAAFMQIKL